MRDLVGGVTVWASTNSHAIMKAVLNTSNAVSCNHEISADGQFVAFEACPFSSGAGGSASRGLLLRHDLATGVTDIVNTNVSGIASGSQLTTHNLNLTPDGRFIAFIANVYGTNGATTAIAVWDGLSNTTVMASLDLTQTVPANSVCDSPTLTPDGRFVAFWSNATNLTANPQTNGFHLYLRDLQTAATVQVDANAAGFGSPKNLMTTPQLSADGSVVVFEAFDADLVANDNNHSYDIFARNLTADSTDLISTGLPGLPSLSPNASSTITSFCLSTNGRIIAFSSEADNLTFGDTNGFRDVYVRDLLTGSNSVVSLNTNGVAGDGPSTEGMTGGDGRFIAFTSSANDLAPNDNNNASDVFLRDSQTGITTMASLNNAGAGSANNSSYSPAVSADGRYVLFFSQAGNLVSGSVSNAAGNLFWRDMQAGTNKAITTFPPSGTVSSLTAAMTPDGKRVVYGFVNSIANAVMVYVWDAQLNQIVYTNSSTTGPLGIYKASISPDGNRIAFHRRSLVGIVDLVADTQFQITNSTTHTASQFSANSQSIAYVASSNVVYCYNFSTASNVIVSASANDISDSPTISADGRFIAYRSAANNLVPGDANGVPDIVLYDQLSGSTALLTASPYGNWPANSRSSNPVFSGDGLTLVWQSWANNLLGSDFNQSCDVFALRFATNAPGSQMMFGISAFGFVPLAGFGSAIQAPALAWTAQPGSNYIVQFKDSLNDPLWQNLTGSVRLIGNQGFFVDTAPPGAQRFYRVWSY